MVAYFGSAVCCTARPIFAGVLQAIAKRRAIGFGARQNIVLVGFVQLTGHHLTLLSQCRGLVDQVAIAAISDGITVQMAEIARDAKTYLVMPRPRANPITSVHGICRALRRGTEISAPSVVACARGLGQLLTMRISPHEPSQISPIAGACTGEENVMGPLGVAGGILAASWASADCAHRLLALRSAITIDARFRVFVITVLREFRGPS